MRDIIGNWMSLKFWLWAVNILLIMFYAYVVGKDFLDICRFEKKRRSIQIKEELEKIEEDIKKILTRQKKEENK